MKVSIRFSILSILLSLLLGVSLIIISVNYFELNAIFLKTARTFLSNACGRVGEQIARYLLPVDRRSHISSSLIEKNEVIPGPTYSFANFLYTMISDDTGIIQAYWGDASGNFFSLRVSENHKLVNENVMPNPNNDRTIENTYDKDMHLLSTKTTHNINYDPRLRPWYQEAELSKVSSWVVYPLLRYGSDKPIMGITAAYPVYDKGKLRGVFGVDIPLSAVFNYVKNIVVTKNSVVFVSDDSAHLISSSRTKVDAASGYKMPDLTDLNMPWITASFSIHKQNHEPIFVFTFNNKKYIAAYEQIPSLGTQPWLVAVVTPVSDIVAPLLRNIFISVFIIIGALIVGIIMATILSSSLSKPITRLANDAELICQLKFGAVKQLFSQIKEISHMANTFMKMKNALNSFQRYMPVALVKNLVFSGKVAEVGGETKEITLLFSDIENFTSLSESMSPEKVMQYLSEYFQAMTKIIIDNQGTVDKYIGDGLMAFWGAPLDDSEQALHACKAALAMEDALLQLNSKWHNTDNPEIKARIGINTGKAIIGNVGSDDRLSYTALGDAVNLANRLESLNKAYGTYMIVSESTYKIAQHDFKFRLLDKVAVKGKKQGFYIYELLNAQNDIFGPKLEKYNLAFKHAFDCYESGEWQNAYNQFRELSKEHPQDNVLKIFIERCTIFIKSPPQRWNGTWITEIKEDQRRMLEFFNFYAN